MSSIISVQDIQRDPTSFLNRVESGESFVVMRDERTVAEVKPLQGQPQEPRPYGLCAGEFSVPADFNEPLPDDILKEFEGQ